jgi:hypothetical protein
LGQGNSRGCGEVGKSAKGAKGANSGGGGEGLLAGGEVCQVCQLWRCPGGMRSGGPGGGEEFGLLDDEVGGGSLLVGGVAVAAEDAADEAAEVGAGGFAEDAARLEGLRGPIDGPERSMAAVIRQEAKPLAPRRFPEGFDAAPPFRRSLHVRLAVRDHTQGKYQYRSAIDSCHGRELP